MTRQPHLYDDIMAEVRSYQMRLFDPNAAEAGDSDLSCSVCGSYLVQTASGYLCCPRGHGRLLADCTDDRCGSWFEPDDA